ncbi:GyrI-like domain-containing protein [Demequina sp. NBRC 110057]|uniref:GyrI-like domain-containing protein n=1 Tax=Demequina sp. NBRC 110057 TaxID=1570346 RepID=UPI000A0773CC|nr:GyrI-like domain-containing protein [Demequina sp. NBRC 110057]
MAHKVDLKRELDSYAARAGEFRVVDVAPASFLMVDGSGDPNVSPAYADALAAIYPVAYALKFLSKRERDRDYVVPPLEALWWADDMRAFTAARDKTRWHWTVMVRVPDWLGPAEVKEAVRRTTAKSSPRLLDAVRLEVLDEGRCVQTLHVGPYDDEGPVLERMHGEVIPGLGLAMTGRHHEIYLSDPRRVAPERLRTILRQPVADAATPALPAC